MKDRKQVCRAAALGMAGVVLVLHAGTASACVQTGGAAFPEGRQELPAAHLRAGAGISTTAREGEKAPDSPEQDSVLDSVLDKWDIDPDSLPRQENEEIPSVPEEIREYFEAAVAGTVEQYKGSTPPASDLSRYSLRADTIRAGVRAKAHALMKKESGQILDRMNSFALSLGGPAIAQIALEMQSRTAGKMAAFGSRQEDDDSGHEVHSAGLFPSSSDGSQGSPYSEESSVSGATVRVPFLSIAPPSKEEPHKENSIENDSIENDIEDSKENHTENSVENDIEDSKESYTENSVENDIEDSKEGYTENSVENDIEDSKESYTDNSIDTDIEDSLEDETESSREDVSESPEESPVRPDEEHIPDSTLLHAPPGMSSFLSYLPGGNIWSDEEGFSYVENSSEGLSSGEFSTGYLSSEDDSSEGISTEKISSGDFGSEEDSAEAGFSDTFSDSSSDTGQSVYADSDVFPDLTANFALAKPITSGRLCYKYGNKESQRADSGSEENDDSGEIEDDHSAEASETISAAHRNVVFIGDSRTVGMEMYVGGREDEYWCAKNSMGYSWMVNTATPSVDSLIGENTDVVILMGVNDLGNVNLYVDYMNEKAAEWKERGARTFFVSVTPVVDSKSPNAKNSRIESFNAYAIENLRNVYYIDAYNRIRYSFGSPDGIHFDAETYREIYRIIHFYLYQGWYEEAGLRFYFDCGQPVTGWHFLDGSWQYMDGAGVRWVKNSRVGDVCLAPYPLTGLTDPDIRILSSMDSDTSAEQ